MSSFLKKKEEANELIRIWKSTLLVEEAMQMALTPVMPKVAKYEGRTYFKKSLPENSDLDSISFLLREKTDILVKIDEEILPFLKHLTRQDALKKRYRQPVEHDFMVGFPTFYYKNRFGKEKLTTLFKFPLSNIEYPSISEQPSAGFQDSFLDNEMEIKISQDPLDDQEFGYAYWLDELFLEEELGILDDEILKFRRSCTKNNYNARQFIDEFCKTVLNFSIDEKEDIKQEELFTQVFKAIKNHLHQNSAASLNNQYTSVFPFALIYELDSLQPTWQLQNDLTDIIDNNLLYLLEKNHPAKFYLYGKNLENKSSSLIQGQYDVKPLTKSQELSIKATKKRKFTTINGPPGTGKTHIIRNILADRFVQFISEIKSLDFKIDNLHQISLVTSTNNRAVDNALEGMDIEGILPASIRVGSRIVLSSVTYDSLQLYIQELSKKEDYQHIKVFYGYREKLNEILKENKKENKSTGQIETSQLRFDIYIIARKMLDAWVCCNKRKVLRLLKTVVKDIEERRGLRTLKKKSHLDLFLTIFPLAGCTLLSLRNMFPMDENYIGMTIVDEAGQCAPSYVLPALVRSRHVVMIGDVMQLEPIANLRITDIEDLRKSRHIGIDANSCRFFSSYMENLRSAHHIALDACKYTIDLKEHFRCQDKIIQVSIELCNYELNVLTSNNKKSSNTWSELQYRDVEGTETRYGGSWVNHEEISQIIKIIKVISEYGVSYSDIAILTPYKGQLSHINIALRKENISNSISSGTVHRFQGGERSIVIFSTVICKGIPQFLNSRVNLLNVALSRAQSHFIFVGSINTLAKGPYTNLLRQHLLTNGMPIQI